MGAVIKGPVGETGCSHPRKSDRAPGSDSKGQPYKEGGDRVQTRLLAGGWKALGIGLELDPGGCKGPSQPQGGGSGTAWGYLGTRQIAGLLPHEVAKPVTTGTGRNVKW